ncbi:MAG: hypothetical protein QOK11_1701, partial [Pseudonocardiales bacterium]|nr:hypothetical protein [Pseudonocardiales bacterium]
GVGWQAAEYSALGLEYADRWRLLDDTMLACRRLWADAPASFSAPSVTFGDIYCVPQPVQQRLPIWLGAAATPASARRIAAYCDGWFPLTATKPQDVAAGADLIGEAMVAAGRDPATLGIRVALTLERNRKGSIDGPAMRASIDALAEVGVTLVWVVIGPHTGLSSMSEIASFTDQVVDVARA